MNLAAADLRTRHAKVAQEYMAYKGYPTIRPLGMKAIEDDNCWYYYYRMPEGLLELEVFLDLNMDPDTRQYQRRVTAFLTDPVRLRDLLSS